MAFDIGGITRRARRKARQISGFGEQPEQKQPEVLPTTFGAPVNTRDDSQGQRIEGGQISQISRDLKQQQPTFKVGFGGTQQQVVRPILDPNTFTPQVAAQITPPTSVPEALPQQPDTRTPQEMAAQAAQELGPLTVPPPMPTLAPMRAPINEGQRQQMAQVAQAIGVPATTDLSFLFDPNRRNIFFDTLRRLGLIG